MASDTDVPSLIERRTSPGCCRGWLVGGADRGAACLGIVDRGALVASNVGRLEGGALNHRLRATQQTQRPFRPWNSLLSFPTCSFDAITAG